MIIETIFVILLLSMFIFLFLTLKYENEAFGAFAIILCIILGSQLLPSIGGVQYKSGANITTSGDNTFVADEYSVFESIPLATLFFLAALYVSFQIITFRRDKKKELMEEG